MHRIQQMGASRRQMAEPCPEPSMQVASNMMLQTMQPQMQMPPQGQMQMQMPPQGQMQMQMQMQMPPPGRIPPMIPQVQQPQQVLTNPFGAARIPVACGGSAPQV